MRVAYGHANNLLVVSDAHVSIANIVKSELSGATHAIFYYHLLNKIKGHGIAVAELYLQAAYAYEHSEFTHAMSSMLCLKPEAYNKLMRVGPEKWARSQCSVNRYSFLTSNATETFNVRLLWASRLPICSMIEAIRLVVEQWFNQRLAAAQGNDEHLTDEAKRKLSAELTKCRRYTAKQKTDKKYRVRASDQTFMVDLRARSCECNEFNLDNISCSHAIAAISEANEPVDDYVDDYYTRNFLVDTYSGAVNHLPPYEYWNVPHEITTEIVLPPLVCRQAGRPRESRVRSGGERTSERPNTVEVSSSRRRRAPKRCGECSEPGHTRRSCTGRSGNE